MIRYLLTLLLMALLITGCGSPKQEYESARLAGKVQFRGRPVQTGFVVIQSKDGKLQAQGEIKENGTYVVEKAPIGEVTVCLQLPEVPPELRVHQSQRSRLPKEAEPEEMKNQKKLLVSVIGIPQRYSRPETSGLTYTVKKEGVNSYDLLLATR